MKRQEDRGEEERRFEKGIKEKREEEMRRGKKRREEERREYEGIGEKRNIDSDVEEKIQQELETCKSVFQLIYKREIICDIRIRIHR